MNKAAFKNTKIIRVAVAVIENVDKRILITQRRKGQHLEGVWEFPGGKIEKDESIDTALLRELKEEVDINHDDILTLTPLTVIEFNYPEKTVELNVKIVKVNIEDILDEPKSSMSFLAKEGQKARWVKKIELSDYTFPEANTEILKKFLNLSEVV